VLDVPDAGLVVEPGVATRDGAVGYDDVALLGAAEERFVARDLAFERRRGRGGDDPDAKHRAGVYQPGALPYLARGAGCARDSPYAIARRARDWNRIKRAPTVSRCGARRGTGFRTRRGEPRSSARSRRSRGRARGRRGSPRAPTS